jgi:uncharacterized membrane protein
MQEWNVLTAPPAAQRIDFGFSDERLKTLQGELQSETSALVVLLAHRWMETATSALDNFRGKLFHHRLTDVTIS